MMRLLMGFTAISLCLSILLLVAVPLTRRRYFAYASQGLFIVAWILAAIFASLNHTYWFAIIAAIWATIWLYKLLAGKIVSKTLL